MKQIKRRTAMYALGLFGGLLAVAVWGKMRFVTDLPRMAYAVPKDRSALQADGPESVRDEKDPVPVQSPEHRKDAAPENQAPETGGAE